MSPVSEIDELLAGISERLAHQVDTLLDLREAVAQALHPGRCVSCYFKLLESSPAAAQPHLTPLRRWLETRIEIAATGDRGNLLEVLPLDLNEIADLETCCRRTIDLFFEDRSYVDSPQIGLRFRFRKATAA
jgi:hypothetical protein